MSAYLPVCQILYPNHDGSKSHLRYCAGNLVTPTFTPCLPLYSTTSIFLLVRSSTLADRNRWCYITLLIDNLRCFFLNFEYPIHSLTGTRMASCFLFFLRWFIVRHTSRVTSAITLASIADSARCVPLLDATMFSDTVKGVLLSLSRPSSYCKLIINAANLY